MKVLAATVAFLWLAVITLAQDREPPYPRSPRIANIEWAPVEEIVRKAKGSDNFPLTWSDDDAAIFPQNG